MDRATMPLRLDSLRHASFVALVIALPGLLAAAPARAQTRTDPRPAEAKTACAAGDVQKGVRLLAELYVATNDAIWIFNQGRCYQQNGQPEQALTRFKEYLRKAKDAAPDDITDAQTYVKELEAELAARQPTSPAPAATVTAPAGGGLSTSGRGFTDRQIVGLAVGGLGVAALGAGAFFSYKVHATEQEVNDLIHGETLVQAGTLKTSDRSGARYELLQWISYGVGVGALAVGTTTFLFGRRAERGGLSLAPVLGPGLAGSALCGSF
jgi:hypothetical protein